MLLQMLQGKHNGITTLVPLGQGLGVQVQAHVPDTTYIFVKIGLGFQIQCTLPEALHVALDTVQELQIKIDRYTTDICLIKARITIMGEGIQAMQKV